MQRYIEVSDVQETAKEQESLVVKNQSAEGVQFK